MEINYRHNEKPVKCGLKTRVLQDCLSITMLDGNFKHG